MSGTTPNSDEFPVPFVMFAQILAFYLPSDLSVPCKLTSASPSLLLGTPFSPGGFFSLEITRLETSTLTGCEIVFPAHFILGFSGLSLPCSGTTHAQA